MSHRSVVRRKGAAVVFSHTVAGSYDGATDTTTAPVTTTYPGYAMKIDGNPDLYKALELIESVSPTLEFDPDTPGHIPPLGATVLWGGETFTAKNIDTLAMAGTATAARIVVTR